MSASVRVNWLCHLPRELRDHILEIVLLAEIEAPAFPQDQDDRREEIQGRGSIYYERTLPLPNLQGLLGCTRQLRQESLETIHRLDTSDGSALQYKLDLAVWGCSLQPTWLLLPVPPKYARQVTVKFRMFDHCAEQWSNRPGEEANGGYAILPQYLLQMLRRFLHHGPSFATNPPGRRNTRPLYPLHIDRLQIDFANMNTEIIVDVDGTNTLAPLPPSWTGSWHGPESYAFKDLSLNVRKIARIGILHGSIDEVCVQYRHLVKGWRVPDSRDKALAAKVLSPYGWGPVLMMTQKLVDAGEIAYSEVLDCRPPLSEGVAEISRELEGTFLTDYEEYGRGWKSHWESEL